jgi:hypothetical protein
MTHPYRCKCCGREYADLPAFHADRPDQYWDVPESKRETDIFLTTDSCVIADQFYFIHGCLDIPIIDEPKSFTFGVWVSLSEKNFYIWQENYKTEKRSHLGPFFGWLCTRIPVYQETLHLKTNVHLRDDGTRPYIELQDCDHPLAMDQHNGITLDRMMEMIHKLEKQ